MYGLSVDGLVQCPYCGEELELFVDDGGGPFQEYVEDCQVCCRPMRVVVSVDEEGEAQLAVHRLDT
jgi:hypothetical protein